VDQERARSSRVVAPRIPPKEAPSALLRDGSCCFKMIHGRAGYSSQVGLMSGQHVGCPHASARCSPQAKQASLRARWPCSSRQVIRGCQRNAADRPPLAHGAVSYRQCVSPIHCLCEHKKVCGFFGCGAPFCRRKHKLFCARQAHLSAIS
jgi:hypothetical protein